MKFILISSLLLILIKSYIYLADKYNIIDKPNNRSSHSKITVRGGGIIFPIGAITWFLMSGLQFPMFFIGLIIISFVSFIDDISPLSSRIRIAVQFAAILLLFSELGFHLFPWWAWIIVLIITAGIINAFNFMDGINGITGGYSLSVLSGIWMVNNYQVEFIANEFIYFTAISLVIFGFFNFRRIAICFAGDVGSVSIAFIITFLLSKLIIQTQNPLYILFLGVYGVDSILTIIYRIWNKENIFDAHRKHLYQLLSNELKIPQLYVATIYLSLQLLICLIIFLLVRNNNSGFTNWIIAISMLVTMILIYNFVKYKINLKLV